jgi:hypothetical protein
MSSSTTQHHLTYRWASGRHGHGTAAFINLEGAEGASPRVTGTLIVQRNIGTRGTSGSPATFCSGREYRAHDVQTDELAPMSLASHDLHVVI